MTIVALFSFLLHFLSGGWHAACLVLFQVGVGWDTMACCKTGGGGGDTTQQSTRSSRAHITPCAKLRRCNLMPPFKGSSIPFIGVCKDEIAVKDLRIAIQLWTLLSEGRSVVSSGSTYL